MSHPQVQRVSLGRRRRQGRRGIPQRRTGRQSNRRRVRRGPDWRADGRCHDESYKGTFSRANGLPILRANTGADTVPFLRHPEADHRANEGPHSLLNLRTYEGSHVWALEGTD